VTSQQLKANRVVKTNVNYCPIEKSLLKHSYSNEQLPDSQNTLLEGGGSRDNDSKDKNKQPPLA